MCAEWKMNIHGLPTCLFASINKSPSNSRSRPSKSKSYTISKDWPKVSREAAEDSWLEKKKIAL